MRLNNIAPDFHSKPAKQRVGRGIGSGVGKTCGRGHKGQKARSGGYHRINFEGGQMPIQRRLPKLGFRSRVGKTVDQICLSELEKLKVEVIDLCALCDAGLITTNIKKVKVILSGELTTAIKLKGLGVTKGARAAIEAVGGTIEE